MEINTILKTPNCHCMILESSIERMKRTGEFLPIGTMIHGVKLECYICVNCNWMWLNEDII